MQAILISPHADEAGILQVILQGPGCTGPYAEYRVSTL
jgi:hypothetical protein